MPNDSNNSDSVSYKNEDTVTDTLNNINSTVTANTTHTINNTQFYNYHEYRCPLKNSIIITHHPNPYPFPYLDTASRVVRIPRVPNIDYPQFSNVLPGLEPGAIVKTGAGAFEPTHTYMNQRFGETSVSPLSKYISNTEFSEIVDRINEILAGTYSSSYGNILWVILNTVFLDVPALLCLLKDKIQTLIYKQSGLTVLEAYIVDTNDKFRTEGRVIRIVQPNESGFLSLDWIVPTQQDGDNADD